MHPINSNKIKCTSNFTGASKTRTYKLNGKIVTDHHYGIDLTGGDEIIATSEGRVIKVVNKGSNMGTMCLVRIQHKDFQSAYYHLESGSICVNVGDIVEKGQKIALMGNTGKSSGKHLHFQIDKGTNENAINPYDYVFKNKELEGLDSKYTTGLYIVDSPRYVRTGAGVNYSIKKVKELTKDGQKHCVNKNENAQAQYEKGTKFTVLKICYAYNGSIWGVGLSGYVCIENSKGIKYCKKIK